MPLNCQINALYFLEKVTIIYDTYSQRKSFVPNAQKNNFFFLKRLEKSL